MSKSLLILSFLCIVHALYLIEYCEDDACLGHGHEICKRYQVKDTKQDAMDFINSGIKITKVYEVGKEIPLISGKKTFDVKKEITVQEERDYLYIPSFDSIKK
jgi:hypothetical protein